MRNGPRPTSVPSRNSSSIPSYGFGQIFQQLDTGNDLIDRWGNRADRLCRGHRPRPVDVPDVGVSEDSRCHRTCRSGDRQRSPRGLGEEVVEAAGRGGGQAVRDLGDDAAIEAFDIAQPGLRFGPRKANVRIPGTGALEEALSKGVEQGPWTARPTRRLADAVRRKWARPATWTPVSPSSSCSPARVRWDRRRLPPTSCGKEACEAASG